MTALIVIAAVILLFALLLHIKVRAEIRFIGGKLDFKIKYLFFTVYPMKKKRRKKSKKPKPEKVKKSKKKDVSPPADESVSDAASDDTGGEEKTSEVSESAESTEKDVSSGEEKKQKEKLSDKLDKLSDLIEKVKVIWGFSNKWLKKIFTHIYLDDLFVDFIIAGEDAHKTAVAYGTVNAALYNVIQAVGRLFPITVKTVDIVCDFDRKEPVYDCGVKITMRPSTALSAAFGILFGFIANYKKIMGKQSGQTKASVRA